MTDPIVAAARAALADPNSPDEATVEAAGIPFHVLTWGRPDGPPLILLHGILANARGWFRIGPALAAAGYRVIAPDMPAHGLTRVWRGHVAQRDNAGDLVAFSRAALPSADPGDVRVVGHSWGAMTAAWFPAAGFRPFRLVLLDPPVLPLAIIRQMAADPVERHYDDLTEAILATGWANPTWSYGDVYAKAEALTQLDEPAVRAVLTENGDWDGGLSALADPAARDVPVRLVRSDPAAGGLVPDAALSAFEERLGAGHVATIVGAPHSPHRTHPVQTTEALLSALR